MDDVFNFIPARVTAMFMVCASFLAGLDGKNAWRIYLRDRRKHASPNAARQNRSVPERLESGSPEMQFILGKFIKRSLSEMIKAGRLMYVTALLMMFVFGGIKLCTVLIM